jgi:hypothetical protein
MLEPPPIRDQSRDRRNRPFTLEAIWIPRTSRVVTARSASTAAFRLSCIGTEPRVMKGSGETINCGSRGIVKPPGEFDGFLRRHPVKEVGAGGGEHLHVDTLSIHDHATKLKIVEFRFSAPR